VPLQGITNGAAHTGDVNKMLDMVAGYGERYGPVVSCNLLGTKVVFVMDPSLTGEVRSAGLTAVQCCMLRSWASYLGMSCVLGGPLLSHSSAHAAPGLQLA
jgi:hypothetical protein